MKFKYRLNMLFKIAKERELELQMELGKLIQERIGITGRIQEIGQNMAHWYSQYNVFNWDPREIGLIENHLSFIDKQKQKLVLSLRDLEDRIKNKRVLVSEANKEKKKFETHEDYKKKEHDAIVKEKESRMMADLIQIHYLRRSQKEAVL